MHVSELITFISGILPRALGASLLIDFLILAISNHRSAFITCFLIIPSTVSCFAAIAGFFYFNLSLLKLRSFHIGVYSFHDRFDS